MDSARRPTTTTATPSGQLDVSPGRFDEGEDEGEDEDEDMTSRLAEVNVQVKEFWRLQGTHA